MRKTQLVSVFLFFILSFTGCAGKDMKKYGGNLALNGGGGNPILASISLAVGGSIYGIGSLVDNEKN